MSELTLMSTDLMIFVRDTKPIAHSALHGALEKKKWHLLVVSDGEVHESSDKPMTAGVSYEVYGSQDAALLISAQAAVLKQDYAKLEKFYKKGLNSIYFDVREVEDVPFCGKEFKSDLNAARLEYLLNAHGGPLQYAVWEAVGSITGGVMFDPQTDEFRRG